MKKIPRVSNIRPSTILLHSTKFIVLLALAIVVASVWSWWNYVYNSPDRMFWGMIDQSLKTSSFTRVITQDDGQQKSEQVTYTQMLPEQIVNSRTVITQPEPASAHVVTESIGTPTTDYVRYTDVDTKQLSSSGKPLDFSKIKGVWSKTEAMGDKTNGQLYNESVLGVIPFSNLTVTQRKTLVQRMQANKVYDYKLTRSEAAGLGRSSYMYNVEIKPAAYIATLKAFAKDVGLTQLEAVDPAQYSSSQPVSVQLAIDGWTHQLRQISYGGGARTENIMAYNSRAPLQSPPAKAISVQELQTRLQSIQ